MSTDRTGLSVPRLVFGLVVLALGVLFTLDRLDLVEARGLWTYWPVIPILAGVGHLAQPSRASNRGWGLVLLIFGGWYLAYNLAWVDRSPRDLWPVLLVLIGAGLVWKAVAGPAAGRGEVRADSLVRGMAILGGMERSSAAKDFRGGDLTAVMGGCDLDLTQASIEESPAVIDTFAFWGGIDIRVPEDWNVVVDGWPILGGFEDSTSKRHADPAKTLVVKGMAIMGGVEVSNK